MPFKILIVNPNSTSAMTDALKPLIDSLDLPNLEITYFTAPPSSPRSIDDTETSHLSAKICLPLLIPKIPSYDAFLIACYSEHLLVPQLQAEISRAGEAARKFVVGIFQASVLHALALVDNTYVAVESLGVNKAPHRWGIVTTGEVWEELLSAGVERYLGVEMGGGRGRFAGVTSTGLSAVELHELPAEEVQNKLKEAVRELLTPDPPSWDAEERGEGEVTVVCLGCAGMVGLDRVVEEVGREMGYQEGGLRVVDGVKAGVLVLEGLLKGRYAS